MFLSLLPQYQLFVLDFQTQHTGCLLEFPEIEAFFLPFQEEIRHMQTSLASQVIVRQRTYDPEN